VRTLNNLVASAKNCRNLQLLGIDCDAFFHWENVGTEETPILEVAQYSDPASNPALIPAWTKYELDYMIGNVFQKPELIKPDKAGKFGKLDVFPIYAASKVIEFENGADATAFALTWLIENEQLDPEKINERYAKFFS